MRACVLPVDIGWNDVGSWSALWEVSEQDADGNAHHGDVVSIDSRNSYAYARRLVALVGVDDLVVVETDDAVLVARKDRVQQVKDVVAQLKAGQRSQAVLHREVHRPWGSYDSIDMADGFQVKRIKVKPGARLSLQSHEQRAEHWVVVRGTARVTRDNDVFELFANQSTYIPIGAQAPAGKPRQRDAGTDRGAVRRLPGRGRHRPLRGCVRAVVRVCGACVLSRPRSCGRCLPRMSPGIGRSANASSLISLQAAPAGTRLGTLRRVKYVPLPHRGRGSCPLWIAVAQPKLASHSSSLPSLMSANSGEEK